MVKEDLSHSVFWFAVPDELNPGQSHYSLFSSRRRTIDEEKIRERYLSFSYLHSFSGLGCTHICGGTHGTVHV